MKEKDFNFEGSVYLKQRLSLHERAHGTFLCECIHSFNIFFNVLISGDVTLKNTVSDFMEIKLRVLKPLIKQVSTIYLIDEVVGKNGVPIITILQRS